MGRVYTSSDWHGNGDLGLRVLDWLSADDKLYFLGDAIDRGPDGIKLMGALISDPRVTYLKGNHEAFLEKYVPDLVNENEEEEEDNDAFCWFGNPADLWLEDNGGRATYNSLCEKTKEEQLWYVNQIKQMPLEERYVTKDGKVIILEHAGYTPGMTRGYRHDPLWDREHFNEDWWEEKYSDFYLVHGHTGVQHLKFFYGYNGQLPMTEEDMKHKYDWYKEDTDYKPEVINYCNNHKFDIDMCTIASNRIALLDLDTFETIYFDGEER